MVLCGGTVLDASKYVAQKTNPTYLFVPIIVSSGSIIHGMCAEWSGKKIVVGTTDMPSIDADHFIVDYGVVQKTPYYLNPSGLGDGLCGYAGLFEWRYKTNNDIAPK